MVHFWWEGKLFPPPRKYATTVRRYSCPVRVLGLFISFLTTSDFNWDNLWAIRSLHLATT